MFVNMEDLRAIKVQEMKDYEQLNQRETFLLNELKEIVDEKYTPSSTPLKLLT